MATAARVHAIESGKSVGDRTLIAFGGAAPLHACQLAEKLGIARIIVPRHAGVGSAIGFLRAPVSYEVVRTLYQRVDAFDSDAVNAVLREMEEEATGYVRIAAGESAIISTNRQAYMRYQGQGHEIAVDMPGGPFDIDGGRRLQARFDREYGSVLGRDLGALAAAEVVAWRVAATTEPFPDLEPSPVTVRDKRAPQTREVLDPVSGASVACDVHERDTMTSGSVLSGPAVISEKETSTVIDARFDAAILPDGSVELTRMARP